MKELFDKVAIKSSRLTTNTYSTSFSLGVHLLGKDLRDPIHSVYGFVRFADEIVDTFHDFDKKYLLEKFKKDTYEAIEHGISLNPILQSFQKTVNLFDIDHDLIETFLKSMEMDLEKTHYNEEGYKEYILGSAEVVGLMCLKIFCKGNENQYNKLKPYAMALGSAFQKVNFLRDLQTDYAILGRTYFPEANVENLEDATKIQIEKDIEDDFKEAYIGIRLLPKEARLGVYVAYIYYFRLFRKIKSTPSYKIFQERIRIPNAQKYSLLLGSYIKHSFNLL